MATENNRFKMSEARLEELKKRLEFLQTATFLKTANMTRPRPSRERSTLR